MTALVLAALILSFATPPPAASEPPWWAWQPDEDQVETRFFPLAEMGGNQRRTIYFRPSTWRPEQRWPLVVVLPGGVADAERLIERQGRLFPLAERHGFLVLVPSSTMAYGSILPSGRSLLEIHEAYVMDAIAEARARLGADPERIFLIGFSSGGAGAWTFARRHADMVRALALVAPAGSPSREKLAPLSSIPVLLVQSVDDDAIRRHENRRAARELRELGGTVRFVELPHGSHGLTEYPVLEQAFEWFLSAP